MINFSLICEDSHQFDSWFKSSADFDKLAAAGMLSCAICGSACVSKSVMAPKISTSRVQSKDRAAQEAQAAAIKAAKDNLKDAKNVGWQFAKEARAIHYGDKEEANIYGRTEPAEAIELIKEGINIAPLPFDPDAKDN